MCGPWRSNDFVENLRGNDVNVEERGEHEHEWLTYSRFEPLDGRNGGRTMEFHSEIEFGRNSNGWPGNPRFPARWGLWLWLEGLRRELGRWSSFRCGGFEIHGGELAKSAGEREELKLRPWRREGEGE